MVTEARQQIRWKHNLPGPVELIIEVLIFAAVFFVSALALETVFFLIGLVLTVALTGMDGPLVILGQLAGLTSEEVTDPRLNILMLFATLGLIAGAIIYCRAIEGRRLATMGLRRGHILREYLMGLLIGFAMFSAAVLICTATGTLAFAGVTLTSIGLIVLFLIGFLIQGMSEELICRGYFLVSLARKQSLPLAIVVSSCAFGAAHLANSNVQPLAIVNIVLFGCFAGVYLLKRGNIWGIAAIHSMWNFAQGNVYGIQVSGGEMAESIFAFTATPSGQLINGGDFGLEGGLAVSAILICALIITLLTGALKKKGDWQSGRRL
jgi:membrane protease YdiL (CAAX protease family)